MKGFEVGKNPELVLLSIDKIIPHPDNPRVSLREDVISAIAANLGDEFPQKHAVHVRPIHALFQLLSGHQRLEASKRKGLTHVWAWVEEIDDATAFMELVTSNNQGELSPLEIGIHALKAVPKAEGGRGKKGGLSEYAEKIGRSKQYVSQLKDAAEVLASNRQVDLTVYLDKAQHLCAIHKLPGSCWHSAVEWVASSDAPVAEVEKRVSAAVAFHDSFTGHEDWPNYMPLVDCTEAVFAGTDPVTFQRLMDLASKVDEALEKHSDLATQWCEWLAANIGGDSWRIALVQSKRIEFENIAWERDNANAPEVQAVSLVLADPPWQYDFAETDNRKIENQYPSATVEEICTHINAPWAPPLADDCVLYLWATAPKLNEALQVMEAWGFTYKTHAVWDKEKIGMGYWFRGQHELLLVGTRGEFSPPEQEQRVSSVFREARGKHSKKPECVYAAIEAMWPDVAKCEFYQREQREGWLGVGNES